MPEREMLQAAPSDLPLPPMLQQGTLHQGLPYGSAEGGRINPLPGKEEVFWGIQVPKVQEEVDVWEQLGQHGAAMHQVPYQCLSPQAETFGEA